MVLGNDVIWLLPRFLWGKSFRHYTHAHSDYDSCIIIIAIINAGLHSHCKHREHHCHHKAYCAHHKHMRSYNEIYNLRSISMILLLILYSTSILNHSIGYNFSFKDKEKHFGSRARIHYNDVDMSFGKYHHIAPAYLLLLYIWTLKHDVIRNACTEEDIRARRSST